MPDNQTHLVPSSLEPDRWKGSAFLCYLFTAVFLHLELLSDEQLTLNFIFNDRA